MRRARFLLSKRPFLTNAWRAVSSASAAPAASARASAVSMAATRSSSRRETSVTPCSCCASSVARIAICSTREGGGDGRRDGRGDGGRETGAEEMRQEQRDERTAARERREREREKRGERGGHNHLHRLELGPRLPPRGLRLGAARPRLAQLRLCVVQLALQPVALAQLRSRKLGTNRRVHVASAIWVADWARILGMREPMSVGVHRARIGACSVWRHWACIGRVCGRAVACIGMGEEGQPPACAPRPATCPPRGATQASRPPSARSAAASGGRRRATWRDPSPWRRLEEMETHAGASMRTDGGCEDVRACDGCEDHVYARA